MSLAYKYVLEVEKEASPLSAVAEISRKLQTVPCEVSNVSLQKANDRHIISVMFNKPLPLQLLRDNLRNVSSCHLVDPNVTRSPWMEFSLLKLAPNSSPMLTAREALDQALSTMQVSPSTVVDLGGGSILSKIDSKDMDNVLVLHGEECSGYRVGVNMRINVESVIEKKAGRECLSTVSENDILSEIDTTWSGEPTLGIASPKRRKLEPITPETSFEVSHVMGIEPTHTTSTSPSSSPIPQDLNSYDQEIENILSNEFFPSGSVLMYKGAYPRLSKLSVAHLVQDGCLELKRSVVFSRYLKPALESRGYNNVSAQDVKWKSLLRRARQQAGGEDVVSSEAGGPWKMCVVVTRGQVLNNISTLLS